MSTQYKNDNDIEYHSKIEYTPRSTILTHVRFVKTSKI